MAELTGNEKIATYGTREHFVSIDQIKVYVGGGEGGDITSDQITDATAIGKQLLTATDAADVVSKIGALGDDYEPPQATETFFGTVKQALPVENAVGETVTAAEFNALLAALRQAYILQQVS